jgi:hypothetical protein
MKMGTPGPHFWGSPFSYDTVVSGTLFSNGGERGCVSCMSGGTKSDGWVRTVFTQLTSGQGQSWCKFEGHLSESSMTVVLTASSAITLGVNDHLFSFPIVVAL